MTDLEKFASRSKSSVKELSQSAVVNCEQWSYAKLDSGIFLVETSLCLSSGGNAIRAPFIGQLKDEELKFMGSSCVDTHTAVSFVTTQLANYKSQQGDLDLGAFYGAALADGRQDGAMNHGSAEGRNARATREIDKSSMTGEHSSGFVLRFIHNFGGNYFPC